MKSDQQRSHKAITATSTEASVLSEATARPWKVFTSKDGLKLVGIGDQEGGGICDSGFGVWSWMDAEGIANANLIVRAVNNHEPLVKALTDLLDRVERNGGLGEYKGGVPFVEANARAALNSVRASS